MNLSYRPNARNVVVYDRIRGADCRQVAVWVTNGILIGTYTSPTQGCHFKLEGLSVERIYLRQRSSDGSVNKTILKPRLALAERRQYTWDFPGVKFRVAAQLAGSHRQGCKVP